MFCSEAHDSMVSHPNILVKHFVDQVHFLCLNWRPADMKLFYVCYIGFSGLCATIALLQLLVSLQAPAHTQLCFRLYQKITCLRCVEGPQL